MSPTIVAQLTDSHMLVGPHDRGSAVRRVVAGHVHRTALGMLGVCSVLACTSCHEQARLEIGGRELTFVDDPPAFALHALLDGELVSHVQPIHR